MIAQVHHLLTRRDKISRLHQGQYDIIVVGLKGTAAEPYVLDLSHESCLACGGFFPKWGELRMFLDENGGSNYLHISCAVFIQDWYDTEFSE